MSFLFDPRRGLIVIGRNSMDRGRAILHWPSTPEPPARLVNVAMLVAIGYDPALAAYRVQVTTGSGVEFAPRIELKDWPPLGRSASVFRCSAIPYRRALESMGCWGWTLCEACA